MAMWEGKGMQAQGQGTGQATLYQLWKSQSLPAFVFIPGSHEVPRITGLQCSTFEENPKKSQGQASNFFCICSLIPKIFIEHIRAGHATGRHLGCRHELTAWQS